MYVLRLRHERVSFTICRVRNCGSVEISNVDCVDTTDLAEGLPGEITLEYR